MNTLTVPRMEIQQKSGKSYVTDRIETDARAIYKSLASDLINKKLANCPWITRVVRERRYDGTQKIVVTYDNGWRTIYIIRANP